MAIAAEALLKLRAVLDDEGFRKAQAALKDLDGQAKRTGGTIGGRLNKPLHAAADGMEAVGRQARRAAVGGLVTTGAGLTYAAVQASNFQDSLSDIKKALGLKVSSPQFAKLSDDFLKLSRSVPVAASDLAELGGMAALAGKDSRQEILKFASDAAKLGVAFRMPGREAAESLLAIQAQLGTTDQATLDLMGTVNRLSDVFPGKVDARDILKGFQAGLGGAGKMAGMTGEQTAGFYSAFLAAGTPADAAATAMKNFLNSLTSGTSLSKEKQSALGELYGMPVDPARKQLQHELRQVNDDLVEFGGNARADAIEKLIEEARFQGKKLIQFEGQTLNLTQAGIIKKRLNEGSSEITKGLKARKKAIEAELKNMPTAGGMVAADLAKRMQADPVGTVMDVLKRIKQLPKDRQVGVVNDIFGKESQLGIAAILSNIGLVQQGFNVAAQATQNADSWLKEYNSQLENTSSQFQLLKNAFNEMAIRIGTAMLPVLTQAMKDLTPTIIELIPPMVELVKAALPLLVSGLKAAVPYLQQFAAWAKANPEKLRAIATNTVKFGAGLIALGVAAGALRNVGTVLGVLFGLGEKIKGLADLPRTIAGTLGAVGPMLAKLKGMFAGLGGLGGNVGGALSTALRGGASGAGGFFSGLLTAAKGLPAAMMNALRGLSGVLIRALALDKAAIGLRTFFDTLRGFTPTMVMKGGQWVVPWTVRLATALRSILPVMALVGRAVAGVFSGPVGWVALLVTAGVALFTFRNQIGQFAAWVKNKLSGAFQPIKDFALGKQQTQPGQSAQQSKGVNPIDAILAPLNPTLLGARIGQAITQALAGLGPAWERLKQGISNGFNAALQGAFQGATSLFNTFFIIPIQGLWNFLVVWIGQTIAAYAILWWNKVTSGFQMYVVSPLQTMWTNFTTWLGTTFTGIQGRLSGIWVGLSTLFNQYVTTPISQWWNWLTNIITQGAANLRNTIAGWWAGISAKFQAEVVTPLQQMWSNFTNWLSERTAPVRGFLGNMWNGLAQGFQERIVAPVQNLWNQLINGIQTKWIGTVQFFQNAWNYVAVGIRERVVSPLRLMFEGLADRIKSVFDGLLGWARNIGNFIVDRVNPVRQAAGFQPLQRFARGGYVNGPTLGLIGEGRDPREYIIPERKMAGAAMNYLNGKRGASVLKGANNIRGFASGGYVKSGSTTIGGKTVSWDDPDAADKILALYRAAGVPDDQIRFSISKPVDWTKKRDNVGRTTINGKTVRWDEKDAGRKIAALYQAAGISDNQINLTMTAARGPVTSSRRKMRSNNQPARQQYQRNWATEPRMSSAARISRGLSGVLPDAVLGSTRSSGWHGGLTNPDNWWKSLGGRPDYTWLKKQQEVERRYWHDFEKDAKSMTLDNLQKKYGNQTALRNLGKIGMFATGGYVKKPTLAWVGEGRDSEYILPQSKMYDASMAYLAGARGMGVVNPPKFASGGVVGRSTPNRAANLDSLLERSSGLGGGSVVVEPAAINATIEVRTGDLLQFEGQQYVTLNDYQRGLREVQDKTLALMRSAQGRRATGR